MFNLLHNKVILFIVSRYITYVVQFVNSLIIAYVLGPVYLGVWGTINLILQYLVQFNLGIPYSLNVMLSIKKDEADREKYFNSAIIILLCLSFILLIIYGIFKLSNINIGSKYNLLHYTLYICIITIITHYNTLFNNLFRVYNRLFPIVISQIIVPVITLIVFIILRERVNIEMLLYIMLIGGGVSLSVFIIRSPIKLNIYTSLKPIRNLLVKGCFLFIYNASFYLIMLSTRGLISNYYEIKEFGYFTFAFTIASTALLFLDSFSFLIYPKLINRLNSSSSDKSLQILESIRRDYILISHFILYSLILIFPFFVYFFPVYKPSIITFNFIALTFMFHVNNFGYSSFLTARHKEKLLSFYTFLALVFNILVVYCLIRFFNVQLEYTLIGTMLTYYIYNSFLLKKSLEELDVKIDSILFINRIMSLRMLIPVIISLIFSFLDLPLYCFCIPIILLIILNLPSFQESIRTIVTIIKNPNVINL